MAHFLAITGAHLKLGWIALALGLAVSGCRAEPAAVTVYTSVDQVFAQQILADFQRETGVRVAAVYDSEAGKTTGFLRRLQREAARPRCDVWWSSEIFGTIELARAGLLEPFESPAAADLPAAWKDPQGRWVALAARARVLAFNPQHTPRADLPTSWLELTPPRWARQALANPQFGTTRGHLAALLAFHGPQPVREFLENLRRAGAIVADGNSHVVRLVVGGQAEVGWTDTDDVWVAQERGEPVDLVYPRLAPDGPVVWIPCTVARVRNGPNPGGAARLLDYLVSARVERALARSTSRNVPVRPALQTELGLGGPLPEALDFERIADALPAAQQLAQTILLE